MVRWLVRGGMDIEGALREAGDAGEDLVGGLGPNKGLDVDEFSDRLLELSDATVTATAEERPH